MLSTNSNYRTIVTAALLCFAMAAACATSGCSRNEEPTGMNAPSPDKSICKSDIQEMVFGPQVYSRDQHEHGAIGKPGTVITDFSINTERYSGEFQFILRNGSPDGTARASSATVMLNGNQIVGPDWFSQQSSEFRTSVHLGAENQLSITIRSAPGSHFTISIIGNVIQPFDIEELPGTVTIGQSGSIAVGDLEIITFASRSPVDSNGSFSAAIAAANGMQLVMATLPGSNAPILLGFADTSTDASIVMDAYSTAVALGMLNPYLIGLPKADKALYRASIGGSSGFQPLVAAIESALAIDAATALDPNVNPQVYQLAAELVQSTFAAMGDASFYAKSDLDLSTPPYLTDIAGSGVIFANPRFVFYGVGVTPVGGVRDVQLLGRRNEVLETVWGWPPLRLSEDIQEAYSLGDGEFEIEFSRGWDFGELFDFDEPVGIATTCNAGTALLLLFEAFLDVLHIDDHFAMGLMGAIDIPHRILLSIANHVAMADLSGLLSDFIDILAEAGLAEEVAQYIWQSVPNEATHQFISSAATVFRNVSVALKILGLLNEQVPFFIDCFAAPNVTYHVSQTNGVLTVVATNTPPVAAFAISPGAGVVGTVFSFDPSPTEDDNDERDELQFRWDFESDGVWDTSWQAYSVVQHSYSAPGVYNIALAVRDSHGHVGTVSHRVSVGGGAGTASHVKLFRNTLPWSTNATVSVLESLGFTPGTGEDQYEVLTSDRMADVDLRPGIDLVVISNDQNQAFYNDYAASQVKFSSFVMNGGSLLWGACDLGWSGGQMSAAGVVLPGQVTYSYYYSNWNYTFNASLPLIAGLPATMDHNYASHERFANLPEGTIVYTVDSHTQPTLIEFSLGLGWVVMTGQPLEHQYTHLYGAPDMEELLPRIISYFVGADHLSIDLAPMERKPGPPSNIKNLVTTGS